MKLSKTSEYALRILIYMAKEPNKLYTATQLVKELGVSDKYLRRLMTDLSKAGFIKSVQGRDGGYTFMKSTNEIFLFIPWKFMKIRLLANKISKKIRMPRRICMTML